MNPHCVKRMRFSNNIQGSSNDEEMIKSIGLVFDSNASNESTSEHLNLKHQDDSNSRLSGNIRRVASAPALQQLVADEVFVDEVVASTGGKTRKRRASNSPDQEQNDAHKACSIVINENVDSKKSHSDEVSRILTPPDIIIDEMKVTDLQKPSECSPGMSPDQYLMLAIHSQIGFTPKTQPTCSFGQDMFPSPTEHHLASYTNEVLQAIRDQNIPSLQEIQVKGVSMQCCNRFGESILHTACRRGFTSVVNFLLDEAHVSIRQRDDCGRTPVHDVCWHADCQIEILSLMIEKDPWLLLMTDKRGFTPFSYSRRENWGKWKEFIYTHRTCFKSHLNIAKRFLSRSNPL